MTPALDTRGWERPLTRAMRADGRPVLARRLPRRRRATKASGRALRELQPPDVTTLVTDSGLRGRGGAGFATGRKWSTMPLGPDAPTPKYVVCNADEMEPGSIKDRFLMARNPHLLLEGMLLAGYATEATAGYIFLRAQYDEPQAALEQALSEAYERGFIGRRDHGQRLLLRPLPARERRALHVRRGVGGAQRHGERPREPARAAAAHDRRGTVGATHRRQQRRDVVLRALDRAQRRASGGRASVATRRAAPRSTACRDACTGRAATSSPWARRCAS